MCRGELTRACLDFVSFVKQTQLLASHCGSTKPGDRPRETSSTYTQLSCNVEGGHGAAAWLLWPLEG